MIADWWQLALDNMTLIAGVSVGFSVVLLFASLAGLPWFLARLPEDYFCRVLSERKPAQLSPGQVLARIGRNFVGGILALAGVAMLVLPGQGLIALLVALTLLDFPGKRRVERWLILRPQIRRALDWLRRRRNKPPFVWDQPD